MWLFLVAPVKPDSDAGSKGEPAKHFVEREAKAFSQRNPTAQFCYQCQLVTEVHRNFDTAHYGWNEQGFPDGCHKVWWNWAKFGAVIIDLAHRETESDQAGWPSFRGVL